MVTEPPRNHRIMHDGLIRLVLEVGLIAIHKVRGRPALHLLKFLLSRSDLHSCINAIGGQRTSSFGSPFIVDLLLDFRISPNKVIKRLDFRLGSVHSKSKVMILEVAANAGKIHEWLDSNAAELLRVTNSRSLEDERRAQRTAADNDLLAGFEDFAWRVMTS